MRYWPGIVLCFQIAANCLGQAGVSHPSFDSTIQILKNNDDAEAFTYAFVDQYLANSNEANLKLFDRYAKELWRPLVTPQENLAHVVLLCNNAYYLTHYGEIYKGIEVYEEAWNAFESHRLHDFDITEYCLKPLANNYSILGDYSSAGNIIKQYLFLAEKEKNNEQIISALINLAVVFHDTGKPSEAIDLLQQALRIKISDVRKTALVHAGLASNFERLGDLVKAKHYATLAISAFQRNPSDESSMQLVNLYRMLAMLSMREHNDDDALKFIQEAQQITRHNNKIFQNRVLAKLNNSYAEILMNKRRYGDALASYQQTLSILLPDYAPSTNVTLPLASSLYAENTIKETLDGIADASVKLGRPEQALAFYELSFATEDLLRNLYNYEDAKLQQQLENRRRTEQALIILYDLAIRTQREEFVTRAFQLAERTKAIILRESFDNRNGRKKIAADSLTKQEQALHYKQAEINKRIVLEQMKHKQADVAYINQLLANQNKITLLIKDTEKAIQRKYPEIVQNSFTPLDIQSLHDNLENDNAVLMEYFMGEEFIFVFTINSKSIEFVKISNLQDVKNDVIDLHALFSSSSAINNSIDRYRELAFKLYKGLIFPQQDSARNLVLIPDGLLSLIPFDALLYEEAKGLQYAAFPYLLKKYTIAYQTSAFMYATNHSRSTATVKKELLGMFPVFKNTSQALTYSVQEADKIHAHMDGKYLYGEEATMKAFLADGKKFPIIHLSTHADAGNSQRPPSIAFIDSTLYLPQIYGLQFSTDLLVLSACETGAGIVVKGEGAISLARGFQFAGVKSIIFSLWRVNDYSTAELMVNFYEVYQNTGSKSDALRQAKLLYLTDNTISNSHKSPYYWAGFVYYGNTEIQNFEKSWKMIYTSLMLGIIVFILVFTYVWKKKYA
jgi:CHAT domain-containing protein